ncbi:hypothetical protein MASR2M29_03890 [Spirochaetota bacterium]
MFRFIKNKLPFLWQIIECFNYILCNLFYKNKMQLIRARLTESIFGQFKIEYADLNKIDIFTSYLLAISEEDRKYFRPFIYQNKAIKIFLKNSSILVFALYYKNDIAGVFFLRFFFNGQAYLGFYTDKEFRGMGLGSKMIKSLAIACKEQSFPLYSTVSTENTASWKAHISNGFKVKKQMKNNYMLLKSC